MRHATDDAEAAYRRMAADLAASTVVAFYNTDVGDVRYAIMDGHNFGLKAAVLSWNRHSMTVSELARRYWGVVNAPYFDDHDTTEPEYAGRTGKVCLRMIYEWLGVPLSEGEKDVPFAAANPFLGVITDMSTFRSGEVTMRSKPRRVARMVCQAEDAAREGSMEDAELSSFVGKLEFTSLSAGSHRLGRAAIAALRELKRKKRQGRGSEAWPEAQAALEFVRDVLPMLPARRMPVGARKRLPPIILYTDAMYRPSGRDSKEVSAIGAAWFDSAQVGTVDEATGVASTGWKHLSMDVPDDILAAWGEGKTKIGQAEALAPVVALLADPEAFRDREVVSYIDNTGVLFGYAKGCSRDVPTARLVHTFHAVSAALGAQVWFSYVPSKANLADLPSRGEFELLEEMGSRDVMKGRSPREALPDVVPDWALTLRQAFAVYAPARTKREKRWRREVLEAVAQERARRASRKRERPL